MPPSWATGTSWISSLLEDHYWAASLLLTATTVPTVIQTTHLLAAKCIFSPSEFTGQSRRDAHVLMLSGNQCQAYVNTSQTKSKQPWMTVRQAMLKRDGNTSMSPYTTLPWTPSARERQNADWFEEGIAELEPDVSTMLDWIELLFKLLYKSHLLWRSSKKMLYF